VNHIEDRDPEITAHESQLVNLIDELAQGSLTQSQQIELAQLLKSTPDLW
jgi:hypothetical protein